MRHPPARPYSMATGRSSIIEWAGISLEGVPGGMPQLCRNVTCANVAPQGYCQGAQAVNTNVAPRHIVG